jgi:hypothetical protein
MIAALIALTFALAAALTALWRQERRNAEGRLCLAAWQSLTRSDEELKGLIARHTPGSEQATALDRALEMKRTLDRRRAGARHDIHALAKPEIHLVALAHDGADYQVVDTAIAQLDLAAIQAAGLLSDATSVLGGPRVFAAALSREALRRYLLPENSPWAAPTLRWVLRLPETATLIVIRVQETTTSIQIETQSPAAV